MLLIRSKSLYIAHFTCTVRWSTQGVHPSWVLWVSCVYQSVRCLGLIFGFLARGDDPPAPQPRFAQSGMRMPVPDQSKGIHRKTGFFLGIASQSFILRHNHSCQRHIRFTYVETSITLSDVAMHGSKDHLSLRHIRSNSVCVPALRNFEASPTIISRKFMH